jgi:putative ATP-binding cassette transporter
MLRKNKKHVRRIVILTVLSILAGLAGFGFITLVNEVIELLIRDSSELDVDGYLLSFLLLILFFFISRRLLAEGVIRLSQSIYWETRLEVVKLMIHAPYRKLKEHKSDVYSVLTHDVGNITQASLLIIEFATSIVLIVACLAYMAYLSLSLFFISLAVIVLGVGVYEILSRKSNKRFNRARDLEGSFMHSFNAILNGAKEINMDRKKGDGIYEKRTEKISMEALINNQKAYVGFLNSQLIGQVLFYALAGFVLLYAKNLLGVSIATIVSYTFVLLYILGPIANVMSIIPFVSRAMISINRMKNLQMKLSSISLEASVEIEKPTKLHSLRYESISFDYGENAFGIGPIDLELKAAEINFIYGGNGSGKTTLVNTLLSIFPKNTGTILLNGSPVETDDIQVFKSMFSVVFGDYYLFDQFYGYDHFDREKAANYLSLFEIDDKVSIVEEGFSCIDLSTGQRKRLALIAALLEDKPVLVLDEWAADQDPYFRKKFYTEIIPLIKAEGKTILAITHDDHYYHCADKLYRMEYGRLIEQKTKSVKLEMES